MCLSEAKGMDITMQFSLIIPAKNAEDTIFTTLMSVINHADIEYEVIVVDDHSTDETSSIVLRLAKQNSRIRYYISSGNGVSSARNVGIEKARGKHLIFIDADDQL